MNPRRRFPSWLLVAGLLALRALRAPVRLRRRRHAHPADLELAGNATGSHAPDTWSYDPAAQRASLSWASLPADDYVLTVFDTGVFANGKPLDGETDELAWWDDVTLPSGDGQPGGDAAIGFVLAWPACADGLDNDADGRIDYDPVTAASPGDADTDPAGQGDPGCKSPSWAFEDPLCQDGMDNDGDGRIDYDAGRSIHGVADADGPDPQCEGTGVSAPWPWRNRESNSGGCGLGAELALALLLLRPRRHHAGMRHLR